jgi:hypothetical protein
LSARDANAKNLADALDFSTRRPAVQLPPYTVPIKGPACKNPSVALA